MFENQQEEVEAMMGQSKQFRSLYLKHRELDKRLKDAEYGVESIDGVTLVKLKKEKLRAKDKLTHLWQSRPQQSSSMA